MRRWGMFFVVVLMSVFCSVGSAPAQETLNAYSIWPENWARPMFEEFEKATGIHVNFLRFSSGEALARIIAEKNNPRVDVLFGGPVETHIAGIKEGVFEPYKPPAYRACPPLQGPRGQLGGDRRRSARLHEQRQVPQGKRLQPPVSWDDLLDPAYKGMIQMADARTSGTAVTRIFSIIEVYGRDENKAFDYMKKLRKNVQVYTKSGGGGTIPVGLGQAGAGIFFIVDALKTKQEGYDVAISFPKEGIGTSVEAIALLKGAKNPATGKKLIDWAVSPAMQNFYAKYKINFIPAHPYVKTEASLADGHQGRQDFPDRRGVGGPEPKEDRGPLDQRRLALKKMEKSPLIFTLAENGKGEDTFPSPSGAGFSIGLITVGVPGKLQGFRHEAISIEPGVHGSCASAAAESDRTASGGCSGIRSCSRS